MKFFDKSKIEKSHGDFDKEEYKNNIIKIIISTKEDYNQKKILIETQRRICFLKTYITLDENFLFATSESRKQKIQSINEIMETFSKSGNFHIKIIQNPLTENKMLWIKWD